MAKKSVTPILGLQQSIFQPKRRGRRHLKGRIEPLVVEEDAPALKKLNAAFCSYVMERAARARVDSFATVEVIVAKILGQKVSSQAAWEWLLNEFLKDRPEYAAEEFAYSVQFGRDRIKGLGRKDNQKVAKLRIERETAEARAKYAEERRANGGEESFYDSNKWQRLRYQVLLESDGRCKLCGRSTRDHGVIMHVDHIKPRSRFPNLSMVKSNLQVLCEDCNRGKANHDTIDWSIGRVS